MDHLMNTNKHVLRPKLLYLYHIQASGGFGCCSHAFPRKYHFPSTTASKSTSRAPLPQKKNKRVANRHNQNGAPKPCTKRSTDCSPTQTQGSCGLQLLPRVPGLQKWISVVPESLIAMDWKKQACGIDMCHDDHCNAGSGSGEGHG